MTTFLPRGARALVKVREAEEKTESGIYLPSTAQDKQQIATVVEVGDIDDLRAGNVIMFEKYAGSEVTIDGEDLLVVSDEDIVGFLED